MEILVENLRQQYGNQLVLDIQSLSIKKGKITGVTGSNGSGKSTLLGIISGLLSYQQGTVLYDKKEWENEFFNDITLVLQKPYLLKRSVYENIEYPLKLRKVSQQKRKEEIEKVMTMLKITDLKEKQSRVLSGGEMQKVALARALVFKPKVLLLDEPTSNIDSESTKIIEKEIINFNKKNNGTVILITHSYKQAKNVCDDIIYLNNGRVYKSITEEKLVNIT